MLSYSALGVVHTYGQVLLELVKEVQDERAFLTQCGELREVFASLSSELNMQDLTDGSLSQKFLAILGEHKDWDATLWAWCCVVANEGRLIYLGHMIDFLYEVSRTSLDPTYVVSSHELSESEKKMCFSLCEGKIPLKDVRFVIDKSLLGGVAVRQGWRRLNLSMQSLLDQAVQEISQGV